MKRPHALHEMYQSMVLDTDDVDDDIDGFHDVDGQAGDDADAFSRWTLHEGTLQPQRDVTGRVSG